MIALSGHNVSTEKWLSVLSTWLDHIRPPLQSCVQVPSRGAGRA